MAMENGPFEDVFPIEHGDFPACYVSLLECNLPNIKGDSRDPQQWDPLMGSFPYYSHTTPIRISKDMGMVWEAYHKGGPIVGGP